MRHRPNERTHAQGPRRDRQLSALVVLSQDRTRKVWSRLKFMVSLLRSLRKDGAGESGFCYEAGASVPVAPVEALLTAPLAMAAPGEPEALPAVLHARTSARGRERRGEEQQRFPVAWLRGRRARALSNGRARKRVDEAARAGAVRRCQCRRGLGALERQRGQLQGRCREDAIGRLRVGRASRQECAAGTSAGRAEPRARAIREGVQGGRSQATEAHRGL